MTLEPTPTARPAGEQRPALTPPARVLRSAKLPRSPEAQGGQLTDLHCIVHCVAQTSFSSRRRCGDKRTRGVDAGA